MKALAANLHDWVLAVPVAIAVTIVVALLVRWLLHRIIDRVVRTFSDNVAGPPARTRTRRRTSPTSRPS